MKTTLATEPHEFLLVSGGPLFQLYRRTHLSGNSGMAAAQSPGHHAVRLTAALCSLECFNEHTLGGSFKIPFLYDLEAHVRFLIALPVLIAAEVTVNQRIAHSVRQFVDRRIVINEEVPRFNAAVESALRGRNSVVVEAVLLLFVYTLGIWIWRNQIVIEEPTWYHHAGSEPVASFFSRLLVCPGQYSHFSVHPAAMVPASCALVPVAVADFKTQPASERGAPG